MTNNSINNIYDKSYKDLFSNKETFLSLLQTFVNNSWGSIIKSFKLPAIIPIVLYNGSNKWTAARSLKEVINHSQIFGENILDFKYELININSYNKVELYEKQNITSAIFLLDQNIDSIEFVNRLKDIVTGFNKLTTKEKDMLKHWLLNVVDEEQNLKENVEKIFNANAREVEEMTSNISKGLEKLKEQGIEQGIEQGKKAGELEKAIKVAERLLQKGGTVEEVAEVTELTEEKVLEIKKNLLNN